MTVEKLCMCFCIFFYIAYGFIITIKDIIEDYKLTGFLTEEEFEIYRTLDERFHVYSLSLRNRIHSGKDIQAAEKTEKEIQRMAEDYLNGVFGSRDDYDLSFIQK